MNETVRDSLESILSQIGEGFEVVVVDAGSEDGSLEYLREKQKEGKIRLFVSEGCERGRGRNIAAQEAKGDVLLHQLDLDDHYYSRVIPDFVELYEEINSKIAKNFYLGGRGINAVDRELFLDIGGYRDLRVEDNDLWRRLLSRDALINLEHKPVCEELGYEKGLISALKRDFWAKYSEMKSGITLSSILAWHLFSSREIDGNSVKLLPWNITSTFFAYLLLKYKGDMLYEAPKGLEDYREYWNKMEYCTIDEICESYNMEINLSPENHFLS